MQDENDVVSAPEWSCARCLASLLSNAHKSKGTRPGAFLF